MKKLFLMLTAVLLNAVLGGAIASAVSLAPEIGAIGMNAIAIACQGVIPTGSMAMSAAAGTVYKQVWTGEIVKQLSHAEDAAFLNGVPDYSRYVDNDVIHLVDAGVDPDVIIGNSTYPIPLQSLDDTDIAVSLEKYSTKTTPITDDELYAISYDKIKLVKEKHANAIAVAKHDKSIHAFAPASNSAATPVLATTGEAIDGRLRLTRADIIEFKKKLDTAKVPAAGRRLVLCSDHVADLLLQDQAFANQYYNYTSGAIANMYGFEVYQYVANPLYTTAGAKKSYGAVAGDDEYQASVFFSVKEMFKCKGSTNMYYSPASTDPDYQRNKVNFTHRYICLPKKQRCIGAIYSAQEVVADPPTGGNEGQQ